MDLKWLGNLNLDEDATFSVDFTDVNSVSTPLYLARADAPFLHDDPLQNLVVPIPAGLRGETGVIRFKLDPSDIDGVTSQVMLGGFNVAGVANLPPRLDPIDDQPVNEKSTLTVFASAFEPDVGGSLTFSLAPGAPAGASIDPVTGAFTWTPTEAQGPGTYPVTVLVSDSATPTLGDQKTFTVTVNEVNEPPVLAPLTIQTVNEGSPVRFSASASDADLPADTLTYSLDPGGPAGASISPVSGAFTWMPEVGPGTWTFTIRVTDNGRPPQFASQRVQISVNNLPPVIAPLPDAAVRPGVAFVGLGSFTDPGADTWTASVDYGEGSGSQPLALGVGQAFRLDHSYATAGTFRVVVTVTDKNGGVGTNSFQVNVTTSLPNDTSGPTIQVLRRLGIHAQNARFLLTFSEELNLSSAQNSDNYRILASVDVGRFGTRGGFAAPDQVRRLRPSQAHGYPDHIAAFELDRPIRDLGQRIDVKWRNRPDRERARR